jgi:hypothetical protein
MTRVQDQMPEDISRTEHLEHEKVEREKAQREEDQNESERIEKMKKKQGTS